MAVHRVTPVDGDLVDLFNNSLSRRFSSGYIKVDGRILPRNYLEYANAVENFEIRDDDVWVCSFPKTGTTWTQEMVWSIANDLDFERGKVPILERFPYLDINIAAKMPSPRFIKSHLPYNLLPRQLRSGDKNAKVIYVCRNAKDTCISFYHYAKLLLGYEATLNDFYELFLGDTVPRAPFWKHVLSFWNKRSEFNILFLKYEDMIKDLPSVIKETAIFLGKNLTNDQVSLLAEHLSFANMKVNPAVNYEADVLQVQKLLQKKCEGAFMRKGTIGQWKNYMTPDVIKRFDDWTDKHLDGTGLSF